MDTSLFSGTLGTPIIESYDSKIAVLWSMQVGGAGVTNQVRAVSFLESTGNLIAVMGGKAAMTEGMGDLPLVIVLMKSTDGSTVGAYSDTSAT